jgi:hypothetical protein
MGAAEDKTEAESEEMKQEDGMNMQTTEKQKDFIKKSAEIDAMPEGPDKDAARAELDAMAGGKKKKKKRGGKSQRKWKKNKRGGRQTKKRR